MIDKSSGSVLMMTLILIFVFNLLLINQFESVLIHSKSASIQQKAHDDFYDLERISQQLQKRPQKQWPSHCVIKGDKPGAMIALFKTGKGCKLNPQGRHYIYGYEDLGEKKCVVIKQNNKWWATHHWRLTLMLLDDNQWLHGLEIRWLTQAKAFNCIKNPQKVAVGRSSWRRLSTF